MVAHTLQTSVDIPYWDQWDFYTPLFNHASLWRIFAWQHGPHREGIGLVADKFLLQWTHWSARAESLLIVGCFCAAAVAAVYLKVKLFGRLTYSDAVIPCMFLMLAHMGAVTEIPNPSYSGFPELLIMLYCLAWTLRNPWIRYSAVLLMNFLLIYTGFGFFMGIITLAILAFQVHRTLKWGQSMAFPVAVIAVAGASFASFFYQYRSTPAKLSRCIEHPHLLNYPWFVALAFALFLGMRRSLVLASFAGAVAALGCAVLTAQHAVSLWTSREWRSHDLIITILAGFSLMFATAAALGRACLGMPEAAQNYRYLGLLVPAFLAGYFYLESLPSSEGKKIGLALFLLAVVPPALRSHTSPKVEAGKRAWVACYLEKENIQQCNQSTNFSLYPDPTATGMQQKLDYLKRNRLSLYARDGSGGVKILRSQGR